MEREVRARPCLLYLVWNPALDLCVSVKRCWRGCTAGSRSDLVGRERTLRQARPRRTSMVFGV